MSERDFQTEMDTAIDRVLDILQDGEQAGVELNPMLTIFARMSARGNAINMDEMPPMARLLLSGMME